MTDKILPLFKLKVLADHNVIVPKTVQVLLRYERIGCIGV